MATSIPQKLYIQTTNGVPTLTVMQDVSQTPNSAYAASQLQEVKSPDQIAGAFRDWFSSQIWPLVDAQQHLDQGIDYKGSVGGYYSRYPSSARQAAVATANSLGISDPSQITGSNVFSFLDRYPQALGGINSTQAKAAMSGASDSPYINLSPEEQKQYGFDSSFVQRSSFDAAKQQATDLAAGKLVQIGTAANGQPLYAPKGSAAAGDTNGGVPNAPTGGAAIIPPSVALQPGSTDTANVKKLQDYLVSQGVMTQEQVNTGYGTYGPQTTAAVKAFQAKLGVDNTSGPGYWGPKTIQAVSVMTKTPETSGVPSPAANIPSGTVDEQLQKLLINPSLTADQKTAIQKIYDVVTTNDTTQADRLKAAFDAATQYSSPYFKAQTAIVTDLLSRTLGANEGDLAYHEKQLNKTLTDLQNNINASRDQLDFTHTQELEKLADSYKQDLENTQQNLAAVGKSSSSVRSQAEGLLKKQNEGLVESSNRQFAYQAGGLGRQLTSAQDKTAQDLQYLKDKATQDRIQALRTAEQQVGSSTLSGLGYSDLLGSQGGSIPRQAATEAMSFATNFVGTNTPFIF